MSTTDCDIYGWARRDFLKLALNTIVLYSMAGFTACGQNKPLRVAIHPWIGYQFIFLAQQKGFLPSKGLELVETTILSDSAKALAEGRVDAAALTLDEVLNLRDQDIAISVVLVFDVSAGADALLTAPDIQTLFALKGKRIGVENSTLGTVMLSKTLEAAGLQRSDVIIVPMEENHFDAWHQGQMDAVLTYEPYMSLLEKNSGLHRIFDSRSLPDLILDVLAVRTEAAKQHEYALQKLIAGHFQALNAWRKNPIDTDYLFASRLGTSPDKVRYLFSELNLPDAEKNRKYLSAPADDMTRSALEIGEIMQQEGLMEHPLNLDRMFLAEYLPRNDP